MRTAYKHALHGGGCLPSGVSVKGGNVYPGGVSARGVSAQGGVRPGVSAQGGYGRPPSVNRMIDRCKNITLSQK